MCVKYIFCNNNLYHKMRWWLDGKGQGIEGSNLMLEMLCT